VEPDVTAVIPSQDAAHYTDPAQAQWFFDRLTTAFGAYCNPRLDPDGTTIRWYQSYTLPLGSWLINGKTACTDDQLRTGTLRPLPDWPAQ
jgi:hypothetical protein